MRILVTGASGFVGSHLIRELRAAGHLVVGLGSTVPEPATSALLEDFVSVDLADHWPTLPDADGIVHLAALSAVGPSFDDPQRYLSTNTAMVTHLGEYLLAASSPARVLLVSSGAVYDPRQPLPIGESGKLAFTSPYALSKVATEHQAAYYTSRGLPFVVVRPFNHIGPGQRPGFLVPDLYGQVRASQASGEPMTVGDLETERDYTDVRDVVHAYRLLLESDDATGGTFNICSGQALSGRVLLRELTKAMGVGDVAVEVDPRRLRPGDPRRIVGDASAVERAVGWRPKFSVGQTVRDFVATEAAHTSSG
ncbi:NAD-dependent epimerase/dehydratase family protein [Nocardioides marmotae]|nr:GDP-mannose 4,6-dehydratase [Nocardioides marmotae]QKE02830.1 NAD-dependent epimerase/dehydratase family protein [Nocardioides marmotae]